MAALKNSWDIIVLDLIMPKLDGFAVCERLREQNIKTPILFLTGMLGDGIEKAGLDLGADDYIRKPFDLATLKARIEAHLRRSRYYQRTNMKSLKFY